MRGSARPDIVAQGLDRLTASDLRFTIENFPQPAASCEDMARLFASLPTTLEAMLDAEYVYRRIFENRQELLEISPFPLFSVLLRRCIGAVRTQTERALVNYLAKLYRLDDVFLRLALRFDPYRERLDVLAREYLFN